MTIPLNNCQYDKTKLVTQLSKISWFIEKHAIEDALKENDAQLQEALTQLESDIEKHIVKLNQLLGQ